MVRLRGQCQNREFARSPEDLDEVVEIVEKLMRIQMRPRAGAEAALEMPLQRRRYIGREMNSDRIAAEQVDHGSRRQADVQRGCRRPARAALALVPGHVRAADDGRRRVHAAGFVLCGAPVDEQKLVFARLDEDVAGQDRAVNDIVGVGKSQDGENTPPDPGDMARVQALGIVRFDFGQRVEFVGRTDGRVGPQDVGLAGRCGTVGEGEGFLDSRQERRETLPGVQRVQAAEDVGLIDDQPIGAGIGGDLEDALDRLGILGEPAAIDGADGTAGDAVQDAIAVPANGDLQRRRIKGGRLGIRQAAVGAEQNIRPPGCGVETARACEGGITHGSRRIAGMRGRCHAKFAVGRGGRPIGV